MFKRFHQYMSPDEPAGGATVATAAKVEPAVEVKATTATVTEAKPVETKQTGNWPENWRDIASRGDAKVTERLARFTSPEALTEAFINAQTRISQGQLLPVLGKDATPEELNEWRAAHGIPVTADKYDLGDFKPTDAGKPMIDKYLSEVAHKTNMTPDQVKANLAFIAATTNGENAAKAERDEVNKAKYEDVMRKEWGDRYRMHENMIEGFLDGEVKQEFKDALLTARMPDGTPLRHSPEMARLLVKAATYKNPVATFLPNTNNPMKGVEERLSEIRVMMRQKPKEYYASQAVQDEYRQLLDAEKKLKQVA